MINPSAHAYTYNIDQFGNLVFITRNERRIIGDKDLAILYGGDAQCPCIFKHGNVEGVQAYADKLRLIEPDLEMLIIPYAVLRDPVTAKAVLDEVNACIATTGRVAHLTARLQEILPAAAA